MSFGKTVLGCFAVIMCAAAAHAANGVVIESKTVAPGAKNISLGIYLENDRDVVAIVIPLEIRTIAGEAYLTRSFALAVRGRLMPWEKGQKFQVISYLSNPYPRAGRRFCSRGLEPGTWRTPDSSIDFRSPDAILFSCVGVEPAGIKPGTDGKPGEGTPSLILTFDVTGAPGQFIIDTTCISPANHLAFVGSRKPFDQSEIPEMYFAPGVITVGKP